MSNKKNLPNIPIYIGDWERDCNVLTLESEAAWMRIVFKLWTKGKQNSIKIPTKSLQNLWRCSEEKMRDILDDLIYNEIAEIKEDERFVEFTCRRFVKENHLSEIRSKASKGNQNTNKKTTKRKQNANKKTQNSDNENENENEIKDDNELFEKSEKLLKMEVDSEAEVLSAYQFLKKHDLQKMESFEMQNKKSFKNYDSFVINFNSKCIEEEILFDSKKLFARLERLNANWHKEEIKPMNSAVVEKIKKYD